MEGGFTEHIAVTEMIQKTQHLSFLGRRTVVPRPLSDATEIYDTDFEDDDFSDDQSPASLDSRSTLSSSYEATTPPLTGGLGQFEFHFEEKPTTEPYSPHTVSKTEEAQEFVIALSPVRTTAYKSVSALNTAVAELDETEVENWTPRQVADWMIEAGFEASVVEKFLIHDICGSVLLDLEIQDLKELDILSFGKRRRVMSSIAQLRSSKAYSAEATLSRKASQKSERRGRQPRQSEDVAPEESVSIIAIEQLLPKPHKCSKGEDCAKWQKQQRKIQRLEAEFAEDFKSLASPSVVASSDILGPTPSFTITAQRLSEIQKRDPQDNVRQFLNFQHVNSPTTASPPNDQISLRLNGLPKLTIPTEQRETDSPCRTPISALRNPTERQARLKAELQSDPYHYGGVASPVDVYRLGTPMSATDIPVTALPVDPCERDASQSVPPQMKYGATTYNELVCEPIVRSQSTHQSRRPNFGLRDGKTCPPTLTEEELANHAGWMRKRKTTRMMRHEWQDHYFNLEGSKLDMFHNELESKSLDTINVDDYIIHAYSTASGSKLSAAFKKSIGGSASTAEPSFAFSLIPEHQKTKKFFEKEKNHHFAVNSGKDRVEWMRKLMLAKAMKKNDGLI